MEGDNSSGSLLHKLLASPRLVKRDSEQQAGESAVLKSFRTLTVEESYPHPTTHGDINSSYVSVVPPRTEIKNDVEQSNTEDCKGEVPQSPPFPSWRRPFLSSLNVLTDSDVVHVTRVETYSDNENEEEDGGSDTYQPKVVEKSLDQDKETAKHKWNLHCDGRESDVSRTDSIQSVLTDRSVFELTSGDSVSVMNMTWSNESSERQQDSSLYPVDNIEEKITSKGLLRESYLIHDSGVETNVDTGLNMPATKDPILREHTHPVVLGNCSSDGQTVSSYRTEDSLYVPSASGSPLKLSTESQPPPTPDGNVLDSSLRSEKQISHQAESWGTATQKEFQSSTDITSPSSALQPGNSMTKEPLGMDQKESKNDSGSSATSPSQTIKEDMTATKKTTSNPSLTLSPKSLSSTSREPYQIPALFSGLRVLKKGAVGEDRETLSEIKQKDTDRALLSLKQHVNKAKLNQHQPGTTTHKKGADPKEGAEAKNKWRQMLNFDDIRNEESVEKRSKDTEDLDTGEKALAKDKTGDSFKFLSSFKPLVRDFGDVSVDLEAAKKKRKNDRELLKTIFAKSPSKSASTDKSPEEVKVCIRQNVFTCTNDRDELHT